LNQPRSDKLLSYSEFGTNNVYAFLISPCKDPFLRFHTPWLTDLSVWFRIWIRMWQILLQCNYVNYVAPDVRMTKRRQTEMDLEGSSRRLILVISGNLLGGTVEKHEIFHLSNVSLECSCFTHLFDQNMKILTYAWIYVCRMQVAYKWKYDILAIKIC
jgi:hypothetical protein